MNMVKTHFKEYKYILTVDICGGLNENVSQKLTEGGSTGKGDLVRIGVA